MLDGVFGRDNLLQFSRNCRPYQPYQRMRKDNLGEKRDGCKLGPVKSFEYFDHVGWTGPGVSLSRRFLWQLCCGFFGLASLAIAI